MVLPIGRRFTGAFQPTTFEAVNETPSACCFAHTAAAFRCGEALDETVRVPPGDHVVPVRDETQPITVVAGAAQTVEF